MRALLMLLTSIAVAQDAPRFEVAAVSISKTPEARASGGLQPSGEFTSRNSDLRSLIAFAYSVQPSRVDGAPAWIDSERYDITAKAPPQTAIPALREMLQSLLKDRFQLRFHRQDKLSPAFALTVSDKGSRLTPSDDAPVHSCTPGQGSLGMIHMVCKHVTAATLPDALMGMSAGYLAGTPVIDQTGLKGSWEFTLDYTPYSQYSAAPNQPGTVSFFDALERQAGLILKDKKLPLSTIVIDGLNRVPSEN